MTRRARRLWYGALCGLVLTAALTPGPADADGAVACSLSATPIAFGNYVPSRGSPSDFVATITVGCTASGTEPVAVEGIIALTGVGGSSGRRLSDGQHRLRYQLYLDPARTRLWGDGSGQTATVSGVVGLNTPFRQSFTVYGRIQARQIRASVGDYTDQITAVLTY